VPVAFAPDGTVEAVAHVELLQWGIMWHPERDPYDERDLYILRAAFERTGGAA
jgi:gamma-glutamyl-gamma-aminobutyrate hydrolase PuuD